MSPTAIVRCTTLFVFLCLAVPRPGLCAGPGVAPDTGTLLQGLDAKPHPLPEKVPDTLSVVPPPVQQPPAEQKAPATTLLHVARFHIVGSTAFTEDVLLGVVAPWSAKELTFPEMEQAAQAITQYYRDRGYFLARAYLPVQEIKEGVLTIEVMEGSLGQVTLSGEKELLSEAMVRGFVTNALPPGAAIRESNLNSAILLVNDLPGIGAQATLKPGAVPGTSDLVLEMKKHTPFEASASIDNYGSRYTGNYRPTLSVTENNLAGLGESVSFRGMESGSGLAYGRLAATIPVNQFGTRLGASYAAMDYKLGNGFSYLGASGNSQVESVYLLHPIIRSRSLNLYLNMEYDHKNLEDRYDFFADTTKKEIHSGVLALYAESWDNFLGGGLMSGSLSVTTGNLDIRSNEALISDQHGPRTNGIYGKSSVTLSRQQVCGPFECYAVFNGQKAFNNLDSTEKFSLGGSSGVRSYPVNEDSCDDGFIATGELRWAVPGMQELHKDAKAQLVAFYDYGRSWAYVSSWENSGLPSRDLAGAGLGLNIGLPHVKLATSYAWKLSSAVSRTAPDQSGRFWLNAVFSY